MGQIFLLKYYLKRAKKSKTSVFEFPRFTGQTTIIFGQDGYGPMLIRINDLQVAKEVLRVVLQYSSAHPDGMDVNEYAPGEESAVRALM